MSSRERNERQVIESVSKLVEEASKMIENIKKSYAVQMKETIELAKKLSEASRQRSRRAGSRAQSPRPVPKSQLERG